MTQTNEDR